jgi:pyroglutamyl-peptidase
MLVVEDGQHISPSTPPLQTLYEDLELASLDIRFSDDAGGYPCNHLFYLSRSRSDKLCPDFMSGFIHVSPLGTGQL